ncbi:MAG: hypothetical protein ISQ46_00010 [Methylophilaceae bacterium]|nr:hypothetical protein [Methylophilaceae bacterium]
MNNSLELIGLLGATLLLIFYYRHAIKSFFDEPGQSLIYGLAIIGLGAVFFLFFQSKGF